MAWEYRNGAGPYYTRSRRVGGRVVREYVGQGHLAQAVAFLDLTRASDRQRARERCLEQRRAALNLHSRLLSLTGQVRTLMSDALSEAGYHEHRGQWRRRRL